MPAGAKRAQRRRDACSGRAVTGSGGRGRMEIAHASKALTPLCSTHACELRGAQPRRNARVRGSPRAKTPLDASPSTLAAPSAPRADAEARASASLVRVLVAALQWSPSLPCRCRSHALQAPARRDPATASPPSRCGMLHAAEASSNQPRGCRMDSLKLAAAQPQGDMRAPRPPARSVRVLRCRRSCALRAPQRARSHRCRWAAAAAWRW